jgi:uncharacterized membrane protein YjjP (DUF1212 family)
MTPAQNQYDGIEVSNEPPDTALRILQLTARLLLEYSARTDTINRYVGRLAKHLELSVSCYVGYREVILFVGDRECSHVQVPELRLNAAISLLTSHVVDDYCADRISLETAVERLENADSKPPEYGRWLLALIFGLGASALAWILRADWGTIAVSGVSSGLGLVARKALGKRHIAFFMLPFTAALIGALLGGIAIRAGWTQTYGICLIVPALMLVPGPHLILSVQEMLENHMQAGIARLGLAVTILVAAALGVLVGVRLTLGTPGLMAAPSAAVQLTLPLDIVLAGLAACAFGAFYNTPRRVLWSAVICGMIGHGIRYAGMEQGMSQVLATLLGCLAIGIVAMITTDWARLPFASVAFAGAVPMMPGVFIYESFAGALGVSAAGRGADPALLAATLALFVKAAFIVGAMAIGLLVGAWIGTWINVVLRSHATAK